VSARLLSREQLLLAFLLTISLFIISVSGEEQYIQKQLQTTGLPLFKLPHLGRNLIAGGWSNITDFFLLRSKLKSLTEENQRLERANVLFRIQTQELAACRALLQYQDQHEWSLLPAQIIGHDASVWPGDLFLDRGERDGVFPYQSAVTITNEKELCYVGRIIAVGATSATLRPLLLPGIKVPAQLQDSGRRGVILAGNGTGTCQLLYLPPEISVRLGETVISSGEVAIMPPGLLLGIITDITAGEASAFPEVTVTPSCQPYQLDGVFLLPAPVIEDAS